MIGKDLPAAWAMDGTVSDGINDGTVTSTGNQTYTGAVTLGSNATLTVQPPFNINPQPLSQSVEVGSNVTFTVGAAGLGAFTGPFTYQWTFNGAPLAGETATNLSFLNLQLTNSGNYACVVDSPLGSLTSSSASLSVFNPFTVGRPAFQTGGLIQMIVAGDSGRAYRLESSTNLVDWVPVVTNTVSGGSASFTDTSAGGQVLRFYRIVLLP